MGLDKSEPNNALRFLLPLPDGAALSQPNPLAYS